MLGKFNQRFRTQSRTHAPLVPVANDPRLEEKEPRPLSVQQGSVVLLFDCGFVGGEGDGEAVVPMLMCRRVV